MSRKVRHRGPDWSGIFCSENALLAHERLAIVDPKSEINLFIVMIKTWYWLLMEKFIIIDP